jgi:hypothetical protein
MWWNDSISFRNQPESGVMPGNNPSAKESRR